MVKPSASQSIFQTMQSLISALKTSVGSTTYTSTQLSNDLAAQLSNIDQAAENAAGFSRSLNAVERNRFAFIDRR